MANEIFYIPFNLKIRKEMRASEYEVFAICYALDQRGAKIYFSNQYLAQLLNKSESTIRRILEKLEKAGWIERTFNRNNRIISINTNRVQQNSAAEKKASRENEQFSFKLNSISTECTTNPRLSNYKVSLNQSSFAKMNNLNL